MEPILLKLAEKYDVHPCGEGGEFESFVLNSPLFHKKILLEESEVRLYFWKARSNFVFRRLVRDFNASNILLLSYYKVCQVLIFIPHVSKIFQVVMHQEDEIAPVAYLKLKKLKFEEKMQR